MRQRRFPTWALVLVMLAGVALAASPVLADDDEEPELEGILDGFDDEAAEVAAKSAEGERRFRLGGHFRLGASYNYAHEPPVGGETDWRGLARLRPELYLEAAARLADSWRLFASGRAFYDLAYTIAGRSKYRQELLDEYESEFELFDTYLAVDLGRRVDLTVGRQVVAWGNSESLRVTDVLNPLDLREPGLADISDLRLALAMTRADVALGRWSLSAIAIHEVRFDKTPTFGSDFYPLPFPMPIPEDVPASSASNTEFGFAASGNFTGWDLAFYLARVFDDRPHLEFESFTGPLVWRHSQLEMVGAAGAVAAGDYLLKAEAAHLRGLEFFSRPDESLARSDLLLGVEYSGWEEASLTLELVGRHLHDFGPDLEASPDQASQDEVEWALRVSRTFFHQTLTVTLLAMVIGSTGEGGGLERIEARYDLNDAIEITGGVVLYQSGDRPGFQTIGANDRLFLDVVYRFATSN